MLFTYKPHKSFPIPSTLGIETECSTSPAGFKSKERDKTPWLTQTKYYKCRGKSRATNLAIFRPLKNLAMSWSDDCHGNPLARITALSSTSSILLLQAQKAGLMQWHLPVTSTTHHPPCLSPVLQRQASVPVPCPRDGTARAVRAKCHHHPKPLHTSLLREHLLC